MSSSDPTDSQRTVEELEQEMHARCELQHDGLKRATFLGMTPEEARLMGERRERITAIVDRIARLRATQ